jgi:predicted Zn-dependent protease
MPYYALAQTRVVAPKNPYKPEDDVKLGRQASAEAEKQYPLLNSREVNAYIERVGDRLVQAIPSEFQYPQFQYSYKVVNVKDLNAFALPGGFTYVNRGLIEAAKNEGELAGVMAHELSHVALRHGTAQYAKAQKVGIWAGIAAIGGAVLGGQAGAAAAQGAFGVYFMKYGREYEREADLLGAQIMARAGYDPRQMANMFRTIEAQGGGGGPEWLSDHPNPGNRYAAINREAASLRVAGAADTGPAFSTVKSRLQQMPPAPATQQARRGN